MGVINDLATDQRVRRICSALTEFGFELEVTGRDLPGSPPLPEMPWKQKRLPVIFKKNVSGYAEFNLRLLQTFLASDADVFYANDTDTLAPACIAGKIREKPVVFDSHEFFTGTPELKHSKLKTNLWKSVEKYCIPHTIIRFTVNDSIAELLEKTYGYPFGVIRNMPFRQEELNTERDSHFNPEKFHLILQGSGINIQRGAEELVQAMALLPDRFHLHIAGSGDVIETLKKMAESPEIHGKITFHPRMPYADLMQLTRSADLGISLDKPLSINYLYSLPNKIFDYIQAGIPILASDLPEIRKVVETWQNGRLIREISPENIARQIEEMASDPGQIKAWKTQSREAAKVLHWENEKQTLYRLFEPLMQSLQP